MTFYHQIVLKMAREIYPKGYLCTQVIKAKAFIAEHYADNINVGDIAGEAFLSKFHFIRVFKNHYGVTPHQYLMRVRVQEAKKLLQTGMPVISVCFAVGFESIPSFTRLYKKATGTTPFAFQNKSNFG